MEGSTKNNKSGTAHLRRYLMEVSTDAKQQMKGGQSWFPFNTIADLFPGHYKTEFESKIPPPLTTVAGSLAKR
jgi:hypothetical protein